MQSFLHARGGELTRPSRHEHTHTHMTILSLSPRECTHSSTPHTHALRTGEAISTCAPAQNFIAAVRDDDGVLDRPTKLVSTRDGGAVRLQSKPRARALRQRITNTITRSIFLSFCPPCAFSCFSRWRYVRRFAIPQIAKGFSITAEFDPRTICTLICI